MEILFSQCTFSTEPRQQFLKLFQMLIILKLVNEKSLTSNLKALFILYQQITNKWMYPAQNVTEIDFLSSNIIFRDKNLYLEIKNRFR